MKLKEIGIIAGFFFLCTLCAGLICKASYWYGIKNFPKHELIQDEKTVSFQEVSNPDPKKVYFYKLETVRTVVAGRFPEVVVKETTKNLGMYEKNK